MVFIVYFRYGTGAVLFYIVCKIDDTQMSPVGDRNEVYSAVLAITSCGRNLE